MKKKSDLLEGARVILCVELLTDYKAEVYFSTWSDWLRLCLKKVATDTNDEADDFLDDGSSCENTQQFTCFVQQDGEGKSEIIKRAMEPFKDSIYSPERNALKKLAAENYDFISESWTFQEN